MRFSLRLVFFTVLLWGMATAYAQPNNALQNAAPHLTKEQAVQIAARFCQKAGGLTLTSGGEAKFPYESSTGCWMPCWRVLFKNQAVVELDDISGRVLFYGSSLPSRSFRSNPIIPQADAIAKAAVVLRAAGITDAEPTPYANQPQEMSYKERDGSVTEANSGTPREWDIVYRLRFGNVPYLDQTVDISLQAETGELNSFNVRFHSPAPVSHTVALTEKQATAAGWNFINHKTTIRNAVWTGTRLCVVQPNNHFTPPNHNSEPLPGPAKIAYVCSFDYQPVMGPLRAVKRTPPHKEPAAPQSAPAKEPNRSQAAQSIAALINSDADNSLIVDPPTDDVYNFGQQETYVQVYIDAENGGILGGSDSGQGDTLWLTLAEWMAHAQKIKVFAKNKRGDWGEEPAVVLSEKENETWFHQIKALRNFVTRTPGRKDKQTAVLRLLIVVDNFEATEEEVYYLDSGKLGKPSIQSDVPPDLRKWLQNLPPKANAAH